MLSRYIIFTQMQKLNDSSGARCSIESVLLLPIGTVFIGLLHKNKARTGHNERSTVCLKYPAKHRRENRQLSTLQRRVIWFLLHENYVERASDPRQHLTPCPWYHWYSPYALLWETFCRSLTLEQFDTWHTKPETTMTRKGNH